MLKTWDFEDRPSTQPRGSTTPDGTSLRRGTDAGGGSPILASRPTLPPLSDEQWGRWCKLVKSWVDNDEFLREIRYIEQGLPLCSSCRLRSATIHDHGHRVCASCVTAFGDYADQAWQDHNDREMQQ